MNATRTARVYNITPEIAARYLPSAYTVQGVGTDEDGPFVLIAGDDAGGWTLHGYIIPRFASGLYRCVEVEE